MQQRPQRSGQGGQRGAGQGAVPRQQSSNQRGRGGEGKERGLWNSLRGFFGNK
jgi:hypothetical protein